MCGNAVGGGVFVAEITFSQSLRQVCACVGQKFAVLYLTREQQLLTLEAYFHIQGLFVIHKADVRIRKSLGP